MKKTIKTLLPLLIAVSMSVPVFADDNGGKISPKPSPSVKRNIKDNRKEPQKNVGALKSDAKDELKEKNREHRIKQVKKHFEKLIKRFENSEEKLGNILKRIEDRAAKMEERGINISKVIPLIADAKVKLSAIHSAINEMKEKFGSVESSSDPTEVLKEVKISAEKVKNAIKAMHRALTAIVREIKAAKPLRSLSPTPSPEASPTATPVP